MWNKKTSGLIGMVIGGGLLIANFRHFSEQGFVAIGMPLILIVAGAVYFFNNRNEN
jgi:hypothetical protein